VAEPLARAHEGGATLGVGFEGGLLEVMERVFTCAWCAVVTHDGIVGIAGGENVLLPLSVVVDVRAGAELGPAMDELTGRNQCTLTELGSRMTKDAH